MIEPRSAGSSVSERHFRPVHGAVVVATVVLAAVIAFAAFSFVAGVIWFAVKAVVVVAIIAFVLRLVFRHASS